VVSASVSRRRHSSSDTNASVVRVSTGIASQAESLLHDRMRLGIVSALAGTDVLTFVELKRTLNLTDGNLSVHARKLEDAGYVDCSKSFAARRPRTEYRLTSQGRRALQRYLDHMEAVIETTRRRLRR
jgi:DNA-binding MarR family transcriptional regulator